MDYKKMIKRYRYLCIVSGIEALILFFFEFFQPEDTATRKPILYSSLILLLLSILLYIGWRRYDLKNTSKFAEPEFLNLEDSKEATYDSDSKS